MMMTVAVACMASPAFAGHDHDDKKDMVQHKIEKMDTNGDNMVSMAEMSAYGEKMFNEADTNEDGMLSADEMMAAKKMKKDHKDHKEHYDKDEDDMN